MELKSQKNKILNEKEAIKKRPILADPKFNDQLVTRFVNNLMLHGKKSTAYNLFYNAIEIVEKRKQNEEKTAIEIWKDAFIKRNARMLK